MNRTIYYRNLAVFALFVAILFATPLVFAETSAPVNICLDNANIRMHNRDNLNKTNGNLGNGTVIQLPRAVAEHIDVNEDGQIDMMKLRKIWHGLAKTDSKLHPPLMSPGRYYRQPRRVYPVKILHSNNSKITINGRHSIGYISLAQLFKSGSYHSCRYTPPRGQRPAPEPKEERPVAAPTPDPVSKPAPSAPKPKPILDPAPSNEATNEDYFFIDEGGSEVTNNESFAAPLTSVRPLIRPERPEPDTTGVEVPDTAASGNLSTPKSFLNNTYNCDNTIYRSSGYARHSCLKNLNLQQKVELVMSDVLKINQMRPEFQMDPRMSSCMVHRESGFNPNAKGGTPDWGMYQVTDGTAQFVRRLYQHVLPDFKNLSWSQYRQKMLGSTLAQADLHHMVVFNKANAGASDLRAMNSAMSGNANRVDLNVIQRIARRYNGAGPAAQRYGRAIRSCYDCMSGISTKSGRVTNSSRLKRCLNRAKH